jgi:hypothetical protein
LFPFKKKLKIKDNSPQSGIHWIRGYISHKEKMTGRQGILRREKGWGLILKNDSHNRVIMKGDPETRDFPKDNCCN